MLIDVFCFVTEFLVIAFVVFFAYAMIKVCFGTRIVKSLDTLYLKEFADYAYNLRLPNKKEKELYIKPFENYVIAFIKHEMTYNPIERFKCNQIMRESKKTLKSKEFQKLEMKVSFYNPIGCGSSLMIESLIMGTDERMIHSELVYLKPWYR